MEDLGRARADSKICGSIYTGGDGGGERGAGGVCRGKSYQENHGGAASPLRALRLREFYSRAAVILCEVVALRVKYERLLASDKG